MFMHQYARSSTIRTNLNQYCNRFCGLNVIAYYSTQIFINAGFSHSNALLVSLGTGVINWLFAIPAVYTIDTLGRRNILLATFPLMSLCVLFGGFSFFTSNRADGLPTEAQLGCVATAIYLVRRLADLKRPLLTLLHSSWSYILPAKVQRRSRTALRRSHYTYAISECHSQRRRPEVATSS